MIVKECMTKKVELANPSMSVRVAAQLMRDGDFGILPIQEKDRLVGMITDRDIVVRGVAEGKDFDELPVREIMSEKVLYCYEDQSLEEVVENLGQQQVRRLPVLSRDKRLVGILSLGDIARSNVEPIAVEKALEQISKPDQDYPEVITSFS